MSIAIYDQTDGAWVAKAGFAIDCDGSPRCYGPNNTGLDFTANGGPVDAPYGYELNPVTGKPFIQGLDAPAYSETTRGMYVSATTYERKEFPANDCRRYLDSETVLFGVFTGYFRKHVKGIVLGCTMLVRYNGLEAVAVAGDQGPRFGEGSIALAKALGIPSNPRHGGVGSGVEWRIYPGVACPGFSLIPA